MLLTVWSKPIGRSHSRHSHGRSTRRQGKDSHLPAPYTFGDVMCLHGLPSYCCAICNRAVREAPETFRRRAVEVDVPRFGASTHQMRQAAAETKHGVRLDMPASPWRQAQADRDFINFVRKLKRG